MVLNTLFKTITTLDIIFERFIQVDKSISRNNEGSGIGLSLVKELVTMHGSTIRVNSTI
ncbi:ATP-binding protein [Clostridium sediminicola]|uniref:ATP-binding protein n=1 Tax=Clostridium sediminicola TaxID=3114879 RepID=UPI003D183071